MNTDTHHGVENSRYGIEIVNRIRSEVAEDLAADGRRHLNLEDRKELTRRLALDRLAALATERLSAGHEPLDPPEEQQIAQRVIDALFGLGRLQALVDDDRIENIDVNGCDQVWVTYADGTKRNAGAVADTDEELVELIRSAAARFGLSERRFDKSHPELDLQLPGGSRLSALTSVVARPAVSIRRHRFSDLSLSDLVSLGTIDEATSLFFSAAVKARKNLIVAGAMNSGKTTLVRALASQIPPRERVVTIEQAYELGLDHAMARHPDLVAVEARPANSEGEGEVSMARLVRRALRMNADRVIVGEVLGDEVVPMLNAMSQGRSGSMCTVHSDSSEGVFRRLASYAVQSPDRLPMDATALLVAGAVHFVVFVDTCDEMEASSGPEVFDEPGELHGPAASSVRTESFSPLPRRRFVSSVREVVGAEGFQVISNEILRPGPDRRAIPAAPLQASTLRDLVSHGFDPRAFQEQSTYHDGSLPPRGRL